MPRARRRAARARRRREPGRRGRAARRRGDHDRARVNEALPHRLARRDGDPLAGAVEDLARVAPRERQADSRLVAWCGATMPAIVRAAADLGWSGLEGSPECRATSAAASR
jgi:hypothetical protein